MTDELLDAMTDGIARRNAELEAEQAVYGLDALDEVELHPVLADGLETRGFGVRYELEYPGQHRGTPRRRPLRRERQRCDLVVVPHPDDEIEDEIHRLREEDRGIGTLFEQAVDVREGEDRRIAPADAFWVEVKSVSQYTYRDGIPVPNRSYASELVRGPASDIRKLSTDGLVRDGALVVLLFAADEQTADHDLAAAAHKWIDADLHFSSPRTRRVPITNRAGNELCAIMLAEVRA